MSTPQDATPARTIRLRTLTGLRWIAIAGQLAALFGGAVFVGLRFEVGLIAVVVGTSILANLFAEALYPSSHRLDENETAATLIFDIVQLSGLLALTGGLHNPFSLLILAPVTIAATRLPFRWAVGISALAIMLVSLLRVMNLPLVTQAGVVLAMPELFLDAFWAALVIGILFLSLYAGRVTAEAEGLAHALAETQMALAREQKLTEIGGLVAAAAHELGTPLATIMLASSELADELDDRPELAEDARLIRAQAERCRGILGQMGREDTDDPQMRFAPISAVLAEAAEPHLERGKRVVLDPGDPQEPHILRRPEIVHGVRNLVQNAVDFARAEVQVTTDWTERWIVVRILDDGPGFPNHLFARLGNGLVGRRESSGRRPGYDGMGLGLFIAKTLLERSGAEILFVNAGGAVVEIRWPREAIEQAQRSAPPAR